MSDQAEPIGAEGVVRDHWSREQLKRIVFKAVIENGGRPKAVVAGNAADEVLRLLTRTPDPKAAGVERDTVAFVQEWMMSSDHEPGNWEREFAAAIDARAALRAADAAPGGGVEAETYRQMHDIAVNDLGYPSILEALEACPPATAAPAPNVQALVEAARPFALCLSAGLDDNQLIESIAWDAGTFRRLYAALAAIQASAGEGVSPPAGDRGQG